MRISRVFVDADLHVGAELELPRESVDHLVKVLRLGVGARITLFNGRGGEYAATLASLDRRHATATVLAHDPVERESPVSVTLMQAVTRGEKMDWVLQKATELGVAAIQPVEAERSVVQLLGDRAEKRRLHWQGILQSACEQCGRNRLPALHAPLSIESACLAFSRDWPAALKLTLDPEAPTTLDAGQQRIADRRRQHAGVGEVRRRLEVQQRLVADQLPRLRAAGQLRLHEGLLLGAHHPPRAGGARHHVGREAAVRPGGQVVGQELLLRHRVLVAALDARVQHH